MSEPVLSHSLLHCLGKHSAQREFCDTVQCSASDSSRFKRSSPEVERDISAPTSLEAPTAWRRKNYTQVTLSQAHSPLLVFLEEPFLTINPLTCFTINKVFEGFFPLLGSDSQGLFHPSNLALNYISFVLYFLILFV